MSQADERFQQLELESQRLKDMIQKVKEEKDALIAAAYPMSERCSLMGSLLSKYICHATNNNEHMVNYIVNVKYTKEFLTIVHSVLRCFLIKYSDELPPEGCEEMSFVMSILGIIVNISKFRYGRDFLATNEFAQGLLAEFINYLPTLPIPSGDGLKRSLLLCLFNTYSRPGPTSSHGWNELLHAFRHSLLRDRDGTFHFYYLSIVLNMLQSLPAKEFIEDFTRIVPMVQLHELVTSDARGVAVLAQNVISGIHALQSGVGAESENTAGGRPVFCVPPPKEDVYCYGIPAATCPAFANPAEKSSKQCCFR